MKSLFKFVGWAVVVVMGFALTNWAFSQLGELITTKNTIAVAAGLVGLGMLLGVWGWVIFTAIKKFVHAFWKWDPAVQESKNCCQNDCGCDRSSR
jgi:hypothetical protein